MTDVLSPHTDTQKFATGIAADAQSKISKDLSKVLADTYTLLVKTHVYHWNVVGPLFVPLHQLLETQYQDLFEAADTIAERIRALGHPTPMSFEEFLPKATLHEETKNARSAAGMVEQLASDHEAMCRLMRKAAGASEKAHDFVTTDMLTQRLAVHEKAIWMLRAILHD